MSPPPNGVNDRSRWPCGMVSRTYSLYFHSSILAQARQHTLGNQGSKPRSFHQPAALCPDQAGFIMLSQAVSSILTPHMTHIPSCPPFGEQNMTLWPKYAIWHHKTWSTLVWVMACCLTAPIHYLNQWWLIMLKVLKHSSMGNFIWKSQYIYPWYVFENCSFKIAVASPRGKWVNSLQLKESSVLLLVYDTLMSRPSITNCCDVTLPKPTLCSSPTRHTGERQPLSR